MKHRQFGSSVREFSRLNVCKSDNQQPAFQRRISTIFWRVENRQCRNLLAQIQAGRRQICRCRAFSKMAITIRRQRTPGHGASLFFYKFARTTLLCNQVGRHSTHYNCSIIGPIGRSSSASQAGASRRFGAYHRHSAARWPACPSRFRASPPRAGAASPANSACQLLASGLRKA